MDKYRNSPEKIAASEKTKKPLALLSFRRLKTHFHGRGGFVQNITLFLVGDIEVNDVVL